MENTNSAINIANYLKDQGYTNKSNNLFYHSLQYRLKKEDTDGSTSEVIFLGDYGNDINNVSKSNTIEIVNKSNIKTDKSVSEFLQSYNSQGYTSSTTTYGNRYPRYDGECTIKKQYKNGTVEEIYFKYKDGKIVTDIESTKTRKVSTDTFYNEITNASGEGGNNNEIDTGNNDALSMKNANPLTSSSSISISSGSKVALNPETILNKIKIVRTTNGCENTEELIKEISNNLELRNKSYKPKEMFASVESYSYFSPNNQLDNILDRIENVVLQIIEANNGELDYENADDTDLNGHLNDVGNHPFLASLLGSLNSTSHEKGVYSCDFTTTTIGADDISKNENNINRSDNTVSNVNVDDISKNENNINRGDNTVSNINVDDISKNENNINRSNNTVSNINVDDISKNENNVDGTKNSYDDVINDGSLNFLNASVDSSANGYFNSNITSKENENNDVEGNKFYYQDLKIYDANGNETGVLEEGKYDIYEIEYDEDGNIVRIRISPDGEPEKWIKIDDSLLENTTVIKFEQIGVYHYDDIDQVMIYDANGNVIGTLKKGDYSVYEVKYDENGNIVAVRISEEDESEKWIYIYQDGEYIGKYYELTKQGIFIYEDMKVIISDKYGNKIGVLEKGSYKIYELKYDEDGNVIAIRISKDSEDEKWIFLKDNDLDVSFVSPDIKVVKEVELDKNGSKINFFNGKTIVGIIGVLVIAVGTVLYKKYKKNNHEEVVEPGEYSIYDTYLEDDEINRVKISKPGDEEAWVELR